MHHDPVMWPDPHTFKPERHLDENGNLDKKDRTIGFGAGKSCTQFYSFKTKIYYFLIHLYCFDTLLVNQPYSAISF